MEVIIQKLKEKLPYLKCNLNLQTIEFKETEHANDPNLPPTVISSYKVKFKYDGINIVEFDTGNSNYCCFDILIYNESNIKYIELKNGIDNKSILTLGRKFHEGHKKSKSILSDILPIAESEKLCIVFYTKDNALQKNFNHEDPHKRKKLIQLKPHIDAWKDNTVILTEESELMMGSKLLPIIKILYDTSTEKPIDLDLY